MQEEEEKARMSVRTTEMQQVHGAEKEERANRRRRRK